MYASGEPCPMCLGAMYLSGIKKGYYCLSIEDAADRGLTLSKQIYEEFKNPRADRTLVMKPMPLDQTETDPIRQWQEQQAKK